MFSFVGGPYTAGITTIDDVTMNYLAGSYNNAWDIIDGGTYTPVTKTILAGAIGLKTNFTAVGLEIGGLGGLHVLNGSTAYVDSGGFLVTNGTATINSTFTVSATGAITTNAASTTTFNGPIVENGTATFNGATNIGAAGTLGTNAAATSTFAGPVVLTNVVSLDASQPASTTDVGANKLYSTNAVKAWAKISTDGAGNVAVSDGFNITSATIDATDITVTFAHAFANANYSSTAGAASIGVIANAFNPTTTTVKIRQYDTVAPGVVNPQTNVTLVSLQVIGRQ